jgi:SAM-dependent methyltransferase
MDNATATRPASRQAAESFTLDQARQMLPSTEAWIGRLLTRLAPRLPVGPLDVLDVGSAQGRGLVALHRLGHRPAGVEPWAPAIETARELGRLEGVELEVRQGRAEALPYEDGRFDLVLAMSVMEHVEDLEASLGEINRVLRPGGVFWFNSASARSVRQNEISRFPLFGWYPDSIKRRIMLWAKDAYPHLVGYTDAPALHWWTPRKARSSLLRAGFSEVWDRWELRTEDETSAQARLFLRMAKRSAAVRFIGDVLIEGAAFAARKGVAVQSP